MTTWTPEPKPTNIWTLAGATVVFDPLVFDLAPVFDTNNAAHWTPAPEPTNMWTPS